MRLQHPATTLRRMLHLSNSRRLIAGARHQTASRPFQQAATAGVTLCSMPPCRPSTAALSPTSKHLRSLAKPLKVSTTAQHRHPSRANTAVAAVLAADGVAAGPSHHGRPCQAVLHTSTASASTSPALHSIPSKRAKHSVASAGKVATAVAEDGWWMVVGLGNPGQQYDGTRHNIGFEVVDKLARDHGIDMRRLEMSAAVGKGDVLGQRVLIVKPMTFMNNSGESVGRLCKFYKIPFQRVLVVADDLDLPAATLKLKPKGGHGGHNGLRSIIQHFQGNTDFPRLKFGIGRPAHKEAVVGYVLQKFGKSERADIDVAVAEGASIMEATLKLGLVKAISGVRV